MDERYQCVVPSYGRATEKDFGFKERALITATRQNDSDTNNGFVTRPSTCGEVEQI
jgi:hypothetical protein